MAVDAGRHKPVSSAGPALRGGMCFSNMSSRNGLSRVESHVCDPTTPRPLCGIHSASELDANCRVGKIEKVVKEQFSQGLQIESEKFELKVPRDEDVC